METGLASAIVVVLGMALSYFGYAVDPTVITGGVQGIISFVIFIAAVVSAYQHHVKNTQ